MSARQSGRRLELTAPPSAAGLPRNPSLESMQIVGRPAISDQLERHLLAFMKPPQAGAFDRADVNKDVLRPVVRLDESEAFLAVERFPAS
jgi:hypothetical protein